MASEQEWFKAWSQLNDEQAGFRQRVHALEAENRRLNGHIADLEAGIRHLKEERDEARANLAEVAAEVCKLKEVNYRCDVMCDAAQNGGSCRCVELADNHQVREELAAIEAQLAQAQARAEWAIQARKVIGEARLADRTYVSKSLADFYTLSDDYDTLPPLPQAPETPHD